MSLPRRASFVTSSRPCRGPAALVLLLALVAMAPGAAQAAELTEDSPEHPALTLAIPLTEEEGFHLREDYWKGELSTAGGKAIRIQLFRHNDYYFFLGAERPGLPDKAVLHIRIMDKERRLVAETRGKAGAAGILLKYAPRATGLHLVMLGISPAKGASPSADKIPAVLFTGYK
ncbi:MAG: hypothetical protein ACC661_07800 [Verrucomicrobiales bacterium]